MTAGEIPAIGRARTVLVFGQGEQALAVLTTVVAGVSDADTEDPLTMTGPVSLDAVAADHMGQTVLPLVRHMLQALGTAVPPFEISITNLAATSVMDIGMTVSGFSADVPILLALLSAALQMPVPQDIAATGHIASPDGEIRPVANLPAKLEAVARLPDMKRFIYPSVDSDRSMAVLSPGEQQRMAEAIHQSCDRLRSTSVADIGELLPAVFDAETIVMASLRRGFFTAEPRAPQLTGPVGRAIGFLTHANARRFWVVLEGNLLAGRTIQTQELLSAWTGFYVGRSTYPRGFGHRLLGLMQSLPPATRRLKTTYPLLPMNDCLALIRLATETDHDDIPRLIDAISGRTTEQRRQHSLEGEADNAGPRVATASVDAALSELSNERLTETIALPIDAARAAYVMQDVTVDSSLEFHVVITAFHLHVLRHTDNAPADVRSELVAADAVALVDRAFAGKGGFDGALAEGRFATQGGMRFVLDVMTERTKTEQIHKHVGRVLKEIVDPLDWDAREAFMADLLARIRPHLPHDLANRPAEVFARRLDDVVKAYVESLDRVRSLLRSM